ncbi:MAG: histidinol-phosphate transaminase [Chloroflexi bacterium]|nr:histidinol-phosphate transaminase [Chloroflexota bacterium]
MTGNAIPSVRIRPDIAAMDGYTFISGTYEVLADWLDRPADSIIKLDTNENLYGPSPKALAALAALNRELAIYPDVECRHLRKLLSDYIGLDPAHILVGAGADELIDLTLRLFLEPGDSIINCPPTFTMYPLVARWTGNCTVIEVPRLPDFSLDVETIEAAVVEHQPMLLFLCIPNNPDGGMVAPETLRRLLELPVTIVVDEAYIEFSASDGFTSWVPDTPNLIILRTLSKWAGLAGLRIGYGVYPLTIIQHLWKIKHPFNVNVAADIAARATLEDLPAMQAVVEKLIRERGRLGVELAKISFLDPLPSQGNYLLCRVNGMSTTDLKRRLDAEGILIRNYNKAGLHEYVRISVGKPEHTDALLAALRRIEVER